MTVFIDGARHGFGRMVMCPMLADTPAELHAMAEAISMRREWYASPATASFPHYDLSLTRRKLALERGAKELTRQGLNAHMKRVRAELIAHGHTWKSAGWY